MVTGVSLPWGIDGPWKLEKQVPQLRLVMAVPFLTMPEMVPLLLHSLVQSMVYREMERFAW